MQASPLINANLGIIFISVVLARCIMIRAAYALASTELKLSLKQAASSRNWLCFTADGWQDDDMRLLCAQSKWLPMQDKVNWHTIAIIVHRDNLGRIPRIVARTNIPVRLSC